MQAAGAVFPDGRAVLLCRVALVLFEPVLGKNAVVMVHHTVTDDFGDDGGAGNGQALGVPVDDGAVGIREFGTENVAVNQQHDVAAEIAGRGQLGGHAAYQVQDRELHGMVAGVENVDVVDGGFADGPHTNDGMVQYLVEGGFPGPGGHLFGIIDGSLETWAGGMKVNGGGDYRAR